MADKKKKKLTIKKEAIKKLSDVDLEKVAGGMTDTGCPSGSWCNRCCTVEAT